MGKDVILRDPVHGDIELSAEELRIIDTPQFQRLRGIRQLGTAHLVYPGATHTRFEHSIGTLHMTGHLLDAIDRHGRRDPATCRRISRDERRLLRIAALLHDVTHLPFGHNIEDQTGLLERHDTPARFAAMLGEGELGTTLDALGLREAVLQVLTHSGELPAFMAQTLSDTIDADLLDYLRRDAYYTGLELRYDARVAGYFRVDAASGRMFVDCAKQGMLREDIVSELLRLLECRFHFSERVYYHHAKVAAGALLARMVEMALRSGELSPTVLQHSTDQSLLDLLGRLELGDGEEQARLRRMHQAFARRQLPKRVLVLPAYLNGAVQDELIDTYFRPGAPETRFAWEAETEALAREELGIETDLIMYCPARRMQLKEARTLVRMPGTDGEPRPLLEYAEELPGMAHLQRSYLRLWKLYVFCSTPEPAQRKQLAELCLARLPATCTNALHH